jgi:hypothetical protein
VEPWLAEDFSEYQTTGDLLRYPSRIWSGATEDVGPSHILLDADVPPGVAGKSMRYDQPSRLGDSRLCHDFTIGRNIQFPAQVREVWVELYAKFSSGFTTVVPGGECRGVSAAAYKFIFARVPVGSRFGLAIGINGNANTFGVPEHETLWENQGPPHGSDYFDGQWHKWRFHFRVGLNGLAAFTFDDRPGKTLANIPVNRAGIYGIALGRNLNQGPTRPQSVWWSGIKIYNADPGWGW